MSDDNIVDLSGQMTLKPVRTEYTGCRCNQVLVDEKTRMLECQRCGKIIEPFDYVWKYAVQQQKVSWDARHLKSEVSRLREQVANLKREERNIKARIRRAKNK